MPVRVLVVCTANICRSPIAEVLLRDRFAALDSANEVVSAGVMDPGRPIAPMSARLLLERGHDPGDHRSRVLGRELVAGSHLVLGMAAEHVREVVALDRLAWGRTFTLRGFARRVAEHGPPHPGESYVDWLTRLSAGRHRREALDTSDDIADPYGGPLEAYARAYAEIERAVEVVAPSLARW